MLSSEPQRLRTRIILWFVAIALVLYVVSALIIVLIGLRTARQELSLLLYAEAESLAGYYSATGRLDFPELEALSGHTPIPVWLRLIENGRIVAQTPGTPDLPISETSTVREGQMETYRLEDGSSMAVVRHPTWDRGEGWVEAVGSEDLLSSTMENLRLSLILTLLLVVPLSAAGGQLLAAGVVRPVDQLIRAIRGMDSRNLTERLDTGGSIREISELRREFNALLDRLQESVERMRRFTADASHELRTPVSILRTGIEVALRKERSAEEYQELASGCLLEIDRVQRTVEGLLTLARESPDHETAAPTTPVDLSAEAAAALASLGTLAQEHEVTLEADIEPDVVIPGEQDRLRLVLVNLLDNALHHSPTGGRVRLELSADDEQARLRVADQGPGVAPEDRTRIFERFYRSSTPSTEGRGQAVAPMSESRGKSVGGLGLSVVRWVVEHHRGTVEVVDGNGTGAVFEVRLPRAVVTEAQEAAVTESR
jgi:signal transduction histidine kinase